MKQTIQTNLLGTEVIIGEDTGTSQGPGESANKIGAIRNVYTDKDGSIKYSILVTAAGKTYGKLIELYACHFRIRYPCGD